MHQILNVFLPCVKGGASFHATCAEVAAAMRGGRLRGPSRIEWHCILSGSHAAFMWVLCPSADVLGSAVAPNFLDALLTLKKSDLHLRLLWPLS